MNRRNLCLAAAAVAAMVAVVAFSEAKKGNLLLLEWAARGFPEVQPVAVLIEMGLTDKEPTDWSGRISVSEARIVRREGYRFRAGDTFPTEDGFRARSHHAIRLPPRGAAVRLKESIATVGVVLLLADVRPLADLTIDPDQRGLKPVQVILRDVLAGRPRLLWGSKAIVRRVTFSQRLAEEPTEDDFPAAAYGPDATLWVAHVRYRVRDEARRVEAKNLTKQPADFKAYLTPEPADQLVVQPYRDKRWGEAIAVTGDSEDIVRCAVAVEADGTVWVVWSARRGGRCDVFARALRPRAKGSETFVPGPEERLTSDAISNLGPVLCTDQSGNVHLAYQRWQKDGSASIGRMVCQKGKWKALPALASADGNAWAPSLTAGPDGEIALAADVFRAGDYDVRLLIQSDAARPLFDGWAAASPRFEARPSLCYDAAGRLWIAYEDGPERWGQDYGALAGPGGHPLYDERSIKVVCLVDGKLLRPEAELPSARNVAPVADNVVETAFAYEHAPRWSNPRLGLDGRGRLWLTYRQKFGDRYATHPGSYWITFARRLDGDHWTEPVQVLHSDGLLDSRPVVLPHMAGGLVVVHNSDGRHDTPESVQNCIYASYLDLPGEPIEPKLVPCETQKKDQGAYKKEHEGVRRVRDYRIEAGGKSYRLLRGEFHRHTEMSWDGGPDGSLEDMFRYAIDAAALDWIGNGDHDNGAGREYSWWLTQKLTDAYHVPGQFTPMFSYERSVSYPHGHRNCLFARRGVRTLPRLEEPDKDRRVGGVHADDTKMLYRYLHEMGGICASHTSATSMGTDWRDHDPEVEPLVEIYQGDRMSYEKEDAPRSGHDPKSKTRPIQIGGWQPKGFVNLALDKEYRLGFEASSDHWSTHISYAIFLAEKADRESILDAARRRHSYAATDNIVLDVKSGEHLMGDRFRTDRAPVLEIKVIGTGPLDRVDVIRNGDVVETFSPAGATYECKWTDPKPIPGRHYYYVRVQQKDGQLAWASPLWIEKARE